MDPIRYSSTPQHISTRTLCRAFSVGPSNPYHHVEEAIGNYDKSPSAGLAGFLLIPTVGLSLVAYARHHATRTQEKIDGNYVLAKEIISAPTIDLHWGRQQLKAGGFVFTDVAQDVVRVLVRKEAFYVSSAVDQLENPNTLQVEEGEPEAERNLRWEHAFSRWASWDNPPILIPGNLTVKDIQLRAANYIRTKAEEDARCYVDDNMTIHLEVKNHFIQMAGIYALAEAALTAKQQQSNFCHDYLEANIAKNDGALNILREIFGYWKPDSDVRSAYTRMLKQSIAVSQYDVSDEQEKNAQRRNGIAKAVEVCFTTLENYFDLHKDKLVNVKF